MPESPFAIARVGFFVSFLALLATGYYANTLRSEVSEAKAAASAAVVEKQALDAKLMEAQKATQASAETVKSCEVREAALKSKVEELTTAGQKRR